MKFPIVLCAFLLFQIGYSQTPVNPETWTLKSKIMNSTAFDEWQTAVLAYQKSYRELCRLQRNISLFPFCGKPPPSEESKEYVLNLLRETWKKNDLWDSMLVKEIRLRKQFAELDPIYWEEELFPEIYAPIRNARKDYIKENK